MITEKDNDLMIISAGGVVIRTDVSAIHVAGRATQGVRLMNLGEGDKVVAVATTNGKKLEETEGNEENGEGEGEEPEENDAQNEDAGESGETADVEGEELAEEGEEAE